MTFIEGAVLAASAAAIGWINWYFFIAGRQATRVAAADGRQQQIGGSHPLMGQLDAGNGGNITQSVNILPNQRVFPTHGPQSGSDFLDSVFQSQLVAQGPIGRVRDARAYNRAGKRR